MRKSGRGGARVGFLEWSGLGKSEFMMKRQLNGASSEPKNNIFEAKLTNWHKKILLPCQKQGRRVAYNI